MTRPLRVPHMPIHTFDHITVYAYDNAIEGPGGRKINTINKQAIEWMCIYLYFTGVNADCNYCI